MHFWDTILLWHTPLWLYLHLHSLKGQSELSMSEAIFLKEDNFMSVRPALSGGNQTASWSVQEQKLTHLKEVCTSVPCYFIQLR